MKKEKTVYLTKSEMEVIEAIVYSDHASDGHGLAGYIDFIDFDMKKLRGSMASLVKKGVCEFEEMEEHEDCTWAILLDKFQEKADKDEALLLPDSLQKSCIEYNGYKLKNLEVA